jgi:hypothetical protein
MTTATATTDREIRSYPKGIKATRYDINCYWQLYKEEMMFISLRIMENYAQHRDVPQVTFRAPRERRTYSRALGDEAGRFMLVVEGWGGPDAPAWTGAAEIPVHDRVNYRPYLARARDRILAWCDESHREVLVDVHEALTAPHHITCDERGQVHKSFEEH